MYQDQPQANLKDQTPEFEIIVKNLESEASRLFNNTNDLLRKADGIMRFPNEPQNPEPEIVQPQDLVSKIRYELNAIAKQNEKLESLLRHLNKII